MQADETSSPIRVDLPRRLRQQSLPWGLLFILGTAIVVWLSLLFTVAVFGYIRLAQPDLANDSLLLLLLGVGLVLARPLALLGTLVALGCLLTRQQPRSLVIVGILSNLLGLLCLTLLTLVRFG